MKNNPWNKKFIEYDDVRDLHQEFGWLTQVHLFFLMVFLSILSFNIKLIRDLGSHIVFS
jgi:hypothetical protein